MATFWFTRLAPLPHAPCSLSCRDRKPGWRTRTSTGVPPSRLARSSCPGSMTPGCAVRRSLRFSLFALVLLGLVGGTLAFFIAQKSVVLTVDGQAQRIGTYADTVAEVLDEEGLEPASHDVLLPAAEEPVGDGDTIVLTRARPLKLSVDGVEQEIYVTALSVDEALDQLGLRADGLVLSASRSERLPLDGMSLEVITPKAVVLVADGQERVVTTTAATAGDLLAAEGIALGEVDTRQRRPAAAAGPGHAHPGLPRPDRRDHRDRPRAARGRRDQGPRGLRRRPEGHDRGRRRREDHHLPRHGHRRRGDRPRGAGHHRLPQAGHRAGHRRHQGRARSTAPRPTA